MKGFESNCTNKIKVFITIDTEDAHFDKPRLITGEGLEGSPGISMIMNMLDRYNFKANFFLNAYEHVNYEPDILGNTAVAICGRGHEVELHTHPNKRLGFYRKPLNEYSLEEQIRILEYGKKLICNWTGISPIAHRGGNYSCNDDTLTALSRSGIPIDSSRWFNNPNNIFKKNFTVNRVTRYNDTIEVPVTYVYYKKPHGNHTDSKFDINWLNADELVRVIKLAKENNLKTLTLFLHSFSFIKKNRRDISNSGTPAAIFTSTPSSAGRYMEIVGIDKPCIMAFQKILEHIAGDKGLDVVTFKEWYNFGGHLAEMGEDYVPVIEKQ